MKKKTANLSVVKKSTQEELERQKLRKEESTGWEEAEQKWKITSTEARQRVRVLRDELESYRDQLDGAPFDIASGDMSSPTSLDGGDRKHIVELVEELNPLVEGFFDMIDKFAEEHGTHESVDFNAKLFSLKMQTAQTGFEIGVLAGVILAGCSKDQIDKFEHGLAFHLKSNPFVVKD